MRCLRQVLLVGLPVAVAIVAPRQAQAAKQWDSGDAIQFVVAGTDDPIAPTNNGSNGVQTQDYNVTTYHDVDHWIDPDESAPNNEGRPAEDLPYSDIKYESDAPAPGGLTDNGGGSYTYTAPEVGGDYVIKFTGTDASQTIGPGESGDRHDADNTDNWWDLDPGN